MLLSVPGASLPHATWRPVLVEPELLVVDKGAGLLTVPGRGEGKADCLVSRLQAAGFPEIQHVPHRLDRDTSGLVVIGRSPAAHRALATAFQERRVSKRYEALCFGWPHADSGEVDVPIGKVQLPGEVHARMRVVGIGRDGGRPSLTRWRVIERLQGSGTRWSRIDLQPVSGRAHQLRLHLQHLGHPILGDELHGTPEARDAAERLCLHAARLEFPHPISKAPVVVQSDSGFESILVC